MSTTNHQHYFKDVSHLKTIDVYRVLELFEVEDQAIGHAVKKLLCAGKRGSKPKEQDVREAIDTLNRYLQMIAEDCNCDLDNDHLSSVRNGWKVSCEGFNGRN